MLEHRIGLIGAGQMAAALARGMVDAELVAAERLLASDPREEARCAFAEATGGKTTANNAEVAAASDVLLLAVKPHQIAGVCREIGPGLASETLVVSIAAGVRLATLSESLGGHGRLVRVMPNTPCLVGQGACGFCRGEEATPEDAALVDQLLSAVGIAFELDEKLLDAVTGLSGSGPAFVYLILEALSDGGVLMGLPRNVATALAAQTVLGAAAMVRQTGEHPAVLKDRVASPGGTTIVGLQSLELDAVRGAIINAVEAAALRSEELGGS